MKIFILNNEYMGMVRQWQELLAWRALLAELFRIPRCPISSSCPRPTGLSACAATNLTIWTVAIEEMLAIDRPVIFDCIVDQGRELLPDDPVGQGA